MNITAVNMYLIIDAGYFSDSRDKTIAAVSLVVITMKTG
jgi:hypothetical protein